MFKPEGEDFQDQDHRPRPSRMPSDISFEKTGGMEHDAREKQQKARKPQKTQKPRRKQFLCF